MMADTENENVAYTWTRLKLPEGLEPVLQEEEENFVLSGRAKRVSIRRHVACKN